MIVIDNSNINDNDNLSLSLFVILISIYISLSISLSLYIYLSISLSLSIYIYIYINDGSVCCECGRDVCTACVDDATNDLPDATELAERTVVGVVVTGCMIYD